MKLSLVNCVILEAHSRPEILWGGIKSPGGRRSEECGLEQEPNQHVTWRRGKLLGTRDQERGRQTEDHIWGCQGRADPVIQGWALRHPETGSRGVQSRARDKDEGSKLGS